MSIKKNTLLNLSGTVIPIAVNLITVPIYLKLIGAERYGTLVILWALMGYFGFMDLGLGRAVAQRLAGVGAKSAYGRSSLVWTALGMTFSLGVLGGLVLWFSADFVLTRWVDMSLENLAEAKGAIPWFVVAMPLILNASILTGALHGRQHFLAMNLIRVTGTTLAQVVPLTVAMTGHISLDCLVPAALSARLVTLIINFRLCRRSLPLRNKPHFQSKHIKPLFHYGGWVSIMSLMAPLLVTIDRMVIGAMAGAKAVTFYTVPYSIVTRLMTLSGSLHSAIFPRLAAVQDREARNLVDRASRSLVALMTLVALPGIALVHPFLILWVGEEFANQSQGVGEVILLGVLINSIVIPHHAYLMANGKPRLISCIYLLQLPIYFLLLWLGLSQVGVLGAALAWTLRVLIDTILLLWASSAFKRAVTYCFLPLILGTASVLNALLYPVEEPVRWFLAGLLILFSICLGWDPLNKTASIILRKKRSVSI